MCVRYLSLSVLSMNRSMWELVGHTFLFIFYTIPGRSRNWYMYYVGVTGDAWLCVCLASLVQVHLIARWFGDGCMG